MNFALVYLVQRIFYRIGDFFHHWYIHGSRNLFHFFISILETIDQTVAIKVTLRYFFQPLYKDYTIVGRILGIIFRLLRILIGVLIYSLLIVIFFGVYLTWLFIPIIFIFYLTISSVFLNLFSHAIQSIKF